MKQMPKGVLKSNYSKKFWLIFYKTLMEESFLVTLQTHRLQFYIKKVSNKGISQNSFSVVHP